MANCVFCRTKLTRPSGSGSARSTDEAKEHVLKRQWITALGHNETVISYGVNKKGIPVGGRRNPTALAMVAGGICYACNSGWMEKVDARASAALLGLARGNLRAEDLTRRNRFDLARWLFKTTCVLRHVAPPELRHLPREILDRAHEPKYLPSGFLAFCCAGTPPDSHALGASAQDIWVAAPSALREIPQRTRQKAAFQYDRLVIGCTWMTTRNRPRFTLFRGVHHVIFESRSRHRFLTDDEDRAFNLDEVLRLDQGVMSNSIQLLVGVEFLRQKAIR